MDFHITHPLTMSERQAALTEFRKIRAKVKKRYKTEENVALQDLSIGKREGLAWIAPERRITLNLIVNDVIFSWSETASNTTQFARVQDDTQRILSGLRPRSLFDVPKEPGICLPYLFIADDGKEQHSIAMTYRLKAHPDVTINLKSETAEPTPKPGGDIRPDAVTNDFRTDLYWGTVTAPGNLKSAKSVWHLPAKRSMKLASRPGLETFLAIVRNDSTEEDYIYHAVARGDPDHPEDAPDVRLVVEQTRQSATKRGITPLTEEQVLTLARQIAASVVPRATN